jgi:hypothetical protein
VGAEASILSTLFLYFDASLRSSVVGPRRRGTFRLDGAINEGTLCADLSEREDRPHPRVDSRAGVMLARLGALRKRLLR